MPAAQFSDEHTCRQQVVFVDGEMVRTTICSACGPLGIVHSNLEHLVLSDEHRMCMGIFAPKK